jgi:hypothetical protein
MSVVEFPSPAARRISRPRWLDLRLVFGIVLVLAAVLIGANVVASARHTDKELAVTHDLAAGTTLRAADIEAVDAQLPDTAHVYVSDRAKAVGKVLGRSLTKGELLPSGALGTPTARTTVNVPFAADAAPKINRGQRIIVWLSTKSCPSVVLLPDVTVQDVRAADAGSFASGGAGQDVVLSVSPDLAKRVAAALAIEDVTIRAGVLTGVAPAAPTTLPALDSCGASPTP